MHLREAKELLAGHSLRVVAQGAVSFVHGLREQCLQRDIPVAIGPCPKSG